MDDAVDAIRGSTASVGRQRREAPCPRLCRADRGRARCPERRPAHRMKWSRTTDLRWPRVTWS